MSLTRIKPSGVDSTQNYSVNQLTANTVIGNGVNLYTFANAAFAVANSAPSSAGITAAYGQANTATTLATAAFAHSNTTLTAATAAFGQANTNTTLATAAFSQANTATKLSIISPFMLMGG